MLVWRVQQGRNILAQHVLCTQSAICSLNFGLNKSSIDFSWNLKFSSTTRPCKNNPILFIFYVYFNAITFRLFYSLKLIFYSYLPDGENRATILNVFYLYFKPILKQD